MKSSLKTSFRVLVIVPMYITVIAFCFIELRGASVQCFDTISGRAGVKNFTRVLLVLGVYYVSTIDRNFWPACEDLIGSDGDDAIKPPRWDRIQILLTE